MSASNLNYKGKLVGHKGWVTAIATSAESPSMLVTSSRDKKVMVWNLEPVAEADGSLIPGKAMRSLCGHNQAVSDVVLSSDGRYALSGSWDKTLRLWDVSTGKSIRTFVGHESDVFSVAFSADNRQIVSAGRDRTIKLWNTLAECKFTIVESQHSDWVSCVRFSPSTKQPLIVSCGWDKLIKVWSLSNCKINFNLAGHSGVLHNITISPDGSLCASGGKDGTAMLWDVNEGKHLYSLEADAAINSLCFSPRNYWLCAATDKSIRIWDLETKVVLEDMKPEDISEGGEDGPTGGLPWVVSMAWSADGNTLFVGSTNGNVYVYETALH